MVRRIVTFILLVAVAAVLLVAAFPQLIGWQRHYYVAQFIAFRGAAVAIAVVAAVVFLVVALAVRPVRGFFGGLTTLLIVFALVSAGVLVERGTGDAKTSARETGDVTVLSWNTRGGAPGAEAIAKLALAEHADVVSLPETTDPVADQVAALMKAGGIDTSEYTLAYSQTDKSKSTSLLIAKSLGAYDVSVDKTTTEILPTLIAKPASGTGPTIVAVHSVAPVKWYMPQWRHDLAYLSKLCSGTNMIMAGDFNSTLDHLKGLGTGSATLGSCRDAALATSNAAVGTWPTSVPPLASAPIDHVMATSDWKIDGFHVITTEDHAGSDHRPVVAQLSPKDIQANP
ncbi:endonuclease/exonuclease/phosphatase family protein [Frondihabitans australicus]|uniref:Endonuclease/exonuclease/phosphatase (EEP) superfamily protein YafD n=1 Tax=Frondihabitans australicus TaxID=386892 RepID=A0A495IFV6_9MICO|nr:endonuclease/exonuclease/phosphatase family protein [Frondihabitans australicus]RKR74887.1 endonuclease/exonuclease/phosphatase (EEP) superfamily protein YafD [Frondihabitans australicus]